MRFLGFVMGSGIASVPEEQQRQMSLNAAIEETLQFQVAKRFKLSIPKESVGEAVQNIAQNNGMSLTQLKDALKERQIPFEVLQRKIESQLLWNEYIQARFGGEVAVSKVEVQKYLARLRAVAGQASYQVAEIVLYGGDRESLTKRLSVLRDLISKGTPFQRLAREFSEDLLTRKQGGLRGWVTRADMQPVIWNALEETSEGAVTPNVFFPGGAGLFAVLAKRVETADRSAEEVGAQLKQMMLGQVSRREIARLRLSTSIVYPKERPVSDA